MPEAWLGQPPPVRPIEVVSRTGGDLAPVDPVSEQGRLLLLAYVWADQVDRLDRLRGACDLAARIPADLRREAAAETIAGLSLEPGTWTVLWHSIFQQYLDADQIRELADGVPAWAEPRPSRPGSPTSRSNSRSLVRIRPSR